MTSQLNYHLSENDNNKPYVLLLHGLFGNLDNLGMLRKSLQANYNVLSVDLPDHGKSAWSEQFSFQHYAQQILDLIEQLRISNLHLVGHSLGGKIAMQMALMSCEKINKLIVIDIAPVAYSNRHKNVFNALNQVDLSKITSRSMALKVLDQHLDETSVSQFLLKGLVQEQQNWRWQFNLRLLERDYPLLSDGISSETPCLCPTLFIKGGKSDYITAAHRPKIISLFPNSQGKVISSAGHWLHAEKPKVCHRMVEEFLTSDESEKH